MGQEDDRRRAQVAGFDHDRSKPVDPDFPRAPLHYTLARCESQTEGRCARISDDEGAATVSRENSDAASDSKPVVMVIEPEVLIRMTVAAYLRECGYKVIEGVAAGDVWTMLESGVRLDVVFCEVQLAGETDGFSLARRLRQTHPAIDVILASGVAGAAEKSKDLCEEGPVEKPYQAADVAARIRLLLERRKAAAKKS